MCGDGVKTALKSLTLVVRFCAPTTPDHTDGVYLQNTKPATTTMYHVYSKHGAMTTPNKHTTKQDKLQATQKTSSLQKLTRDSGIQWIIQNHFSVKTPFLLAYPVFAHKNSLLSWLE